MPSPDLAPDLGALLAQPHLRIHLLGVAGSGMSGLARLLLERGFAVSGSDLQAPPSLRRLIDDGLTFFEGHQPSHIDGIHLLAYSSAIAPTNPERAAARERGIPQVRRADLLSALARPKRTLAVAGTHGKTTTASMLTIALTEAGFNPSFYIGAEVPSLGRNAAWTDGPWMVIEVDESDGSLSAFNPDAAVILNIEEEHLDHFDSLEQIEAAFIALAQRTSGPIIFSADDPAASRCLAHLPNAQGVGFQSTAPWHIDHCQLSPSGSSFHLLHAGSRLGPVHLAVPGRHNASNAAAAFALAMRLGAGPDEIARGLARFGGASRRFEIKFDDPHCLVVDDYAHHPSEIKATLAAARSRGRPRILALFQPHRYSRTLALKDQFAHAFDLADAVLFTDIYPASEEPLPGVDGTTLPAAVRAAGHPDVDYTPSLKAAKTRLTEKLQPGDLLLIMGAGNVHWVAAQLAKELTQIREARAHASPHCIFRPYEPMRKHTTFRIGGPAQIWFEPASEEALLAMLRHARAVGLPVTVIGRGSNLLVRDLGIPGLCLHLGQPAFSQIEVSGHRIRAGAGARLKQIAAAARKAALSGFEFMEGIPGNLGGALRMNAGAMNSATFDRVESVRLLTPDLTIVERPAADFTPAYRHVPLLRDHLALAATLSGTPADEPSIRETLREFSSRRWASQPASPSAGCAFKNPDAIPAGKLIEELGLKDKKIGGARISPVHANFIVNDGHATAEDVLELLNLVRNTAARQRGIDLEPELILIGEAP
ncbi:MAG: UDP-N-acetylmuramate--L-alanine ligase [Verrucomicrobiia bacterium]